MTTIGPNSRVKCIIDRPWRKISTTEQKPGPKYGDICTIITVVADPPDEWLYLQGWDGAAFNVKHFRPLDWLDDLEEVAKRNKIEQPQGEFALMLEELALTLNDLEQVVENVHRS